MQAMARRAGKKPTRHFPVIVELDANGVYIVTCPVFKGCHSYGKTVDEALANIREAIGLCIEETPTAPTHRFVGFREVELEVDG